MALRVPRQVGQSLIIGRGKSKFRATLTGVGPEGAHLQLDIVVPNNAQSIHLIFGNRPPVTIGISGAADNKAAFLISAGNDVPIERGENDGSSASEPGAVGRGRLA